MMPVIQEEGTSRQAWRCLKTKAKQNKRILKRKREKEEPLTKATKGILRRECYEILFYLIFIISRLYFFAIWGWVNR